MWFRRDLRVRDNPALLAALAEGTVTALFVVDPAIWSGAGAARRAWLAANVLALAERVPLTIRHGDPRDVVPRVAGGRRVHVSAEPTPYGRRRDDAVGERVELVATGSPWRIVSGIFSARASTLAASHARRAGPAPDQRAGSTTKRAVVVPSSSAARRAGLSRTRRSRRNHMTAELDDMSFNVARR